VPRSIRVYVCAFYIFFILHMCCIIVARWDGPDIIEA